MLFELTRVIRDIVTVEISFHDDSDLMGRTVQ